MTPEQLKAIRTIVEREQDRVMLRLLNPETSSLTRPHLERYLAETRIAAQAWAPIDHSIATGNCDCAPQCQQAAAERTVS